MANNTNSDVPMKAEDDPFAEFLDMDLSAHTAGSSGAGLETTRQAEVGASSPSASSSSSSASSGTAASTSAKGSSTSPSSDVNDVKKVPEAAQQKEKQLPTSGSKRPEPSSNDDGTLPTVVINVGMAGSGKSTLMHRMYLELLAQKKRVYMINLDPAVRDVKYPRHIDIRDTIDYKGVMSEYGHGPNGAIMTSLGLFAMKFDQVLGLLEKRAKDFDYVLIDTPGQIEVFGWSASGQIIADTLSTGYPTVINYVLDSARCTRPVTFMSNMLYACSILYKFQLPFVLSFNKCDVLNCSFVRDLWFKDQRAFLEALGKEEKTYLGSLSRSMSHVLEEFYTNLTSCNVSAHTGEGVSTSLLSESLPLARKEYYDLYLTYLKDRAAYVSKKRDEEAAEKMKTFEEKMKVTKNN
ncbi:unnamed protein product [Amoebophrya sp. A25]|nr:unnamed protein product [Amoebophrya sp. A25]|eukprot:GSA25T00026781001.1